MKRGIYYHETLTAFIPLPPAIRPTAKMHKNVLRVGKSKGLAPAESSNAPIIPNANADTMQESYAKMADYITDPRLDRCFRWALRHLANDFMCARPWRKNGKYIIPKTECIRRKNEWNLIVDEYISKKVELGDKRSDEEIARLNKVNWKGSANWKHCGNPECSHEEVEPMSYLACSQCDMVCYCSRECQKAHWKQHKRECGDRRTEHLLPSQAVLLEVPVMEAQIQGFDEVFKEKYDSEVLNGSTVLDLLLLELD
jgi:hypothetical protein